MGLENYLPILSPLYLNHGLQRLLLTRPIDFVVHGFASVRERSRSSIKAIRTGSRIVLRAAGSLVRSH